MNRIINFLREVRVELAKVSWPTKKQLIAYTLIVVALSIFMAIFLGALDFAFEFIISKFL